MATYVIGDIQGCFTTLERLLERIGFDPARDRIWITGDLVNRGPQSLEVLRWASALGDRVITVLGNHDLHLLARAAGVRKPKMSDTLDAILEAADRDVLLDWLAHRPLLHRENDAVLVHAGLLPEWSIELAEALAWEGQDALRSRDRARTLTSLYYKRRPNQWSRGLKGHGRLQLIFDGFTRLRTCSERGELCLDYSGPPQGAPRGCKPWYELRPAGEKVTFFFGHWAALGLYRGERAIGLDSGCVWGGALSAYRLEDGTVFQEKR